MTKEKQLLIGPVIGTIETLPPGKRLMKADGRGLDSGIINLQIK